MAQAVEFDALGKRFALRMTINALCQIEAEAKIPFSAVVEAMRGGSILTLRQMFGAALGGKLPADRVGEIIDDIGIERAGDLLSQAMALAFPQDDGAEETQSGN